MIQILRILKSESKPCICYKNLPSFTSCFFQLFFFFHSEILILNHQHQSLLIHLSFTNPGGQSVNIKIKKSAMLTSGESFNAQNLQNWLSATMAQYAAAGKTLVINVQLGVYDMNYLNTYQPDAAKRSANNGRIAIFLMPADASTGTVVRALVAQPDGSGGTGSGGGTGYDLGGLQP
jgi:hypothetical protein